MDAASLARNAAMVTATAAAKGSLTATASGVALPQAMLLRPHGAASFGGPGSSALDDLRGGEMGGRVGLLPGLRSKQMDKYAQAANVKPRRAPRENLDGLTAEERVQRRKNRARVYSNIARERYERLQQELESDVAAMRMFQMVLEEAPKMVVVLSMDIHCLVLYANEAFARHLSRAPMSVLGRLVHVEDRRTVLSCISTTILTMVSPPRPVRCRLRHGTTSAHQAFDLSIRYGTQGLVCTLWAVSA